MSTKATDSMFVWVIKGLFNIQILLFLHQLVTHYATVLYMFAEIDLKYLNKKEKFTDIIVVLLNQKEFSEFNLSSVGSVLNS